MATEVRELPQNRLKVVTQDKYGNTKDYIFARSNPGEAYKPVGDYTWTAVEALWEESYLVTCDFDELEVNKEDVFDF
jgi:hypothetical protein